MGLGIDPAALRSMLYTARAGYLTLRLSQLQRRSEDRHPILSIWDSKIAGHRMRGERAVRRH
jgi:hypothetical protein